MSTPPDGSGVAGAVEGLLRRPELASEVSSLPLDGTAETALGAVVGPMRLSVHARALIAAMADPEEGRRLVRRIAEDRSKSTPDRATLRAYKCELSDTKNALARYLVPFVAEGLSSQRVVALGVLGDEQLLRRIAGDVTESALVRAWCRILLTHRRLSEFDSVEHLELQEAAPCALRPL
jgi:hypothetical protein